MLYDPLNSLSRSEMVFLDDVTLGESLSRPGWKTERESGD